MATIQDVARRAGVGVGTVSRVLNGRPRVAATTRQRVLEAIEELDYHPSRSARGLSLGRTSTIGVLVPFVTQLSTVERIRGVVGSLSETPYDVTLFAVETPGQRDVAFRRLARPGEVDGLLVISLPPRTHEVQRCLTGRVPVVLVDTRHPQLPSVITDDMAGGMLATRHLLELGHRRIAFVGDTPPQDFGFTASARRWEGYRAALRAAGIPPDRQLERVGPYGREVAHQLTKELLGLPEPPTAIFAASDTQALGVLEAATLAGLSVPRDLAIVGFDDIEVAPYAGLTTIHQPLRESGARGVALLMDLLAGGPKAPRHEELPLELVVRRTTAAVPAPDAAIVGEDAS